ncbi:MAG: TlpA family protein disulfide reductase, partial [Pedobacter sp.]
DQFGKSVSIAEFKGKYVLIDFWASWCIPCRKENPNVVSAYAKYHSKGFQILAVSLDTSKSSWLKAIKNDNLSWTHVSDLGGWENEVSRMLKVSEVPSNILVDQNGIVIAKNLKGDNLHRKLAELFDNSQK